MSDVSHQLITLCLEHGVTNFVLCPGARNASLVLHLQRSESIELCYHPDERGAAFFALGRTMSLDEPCAVITTSGTAVAECLPAIIEAHYQARPLIIISADRPIKYRETGAPQTIVQTGLFSPYAAFGIDYEADGESPFNEWNTSSPLHINLPLQEQFEASQITGFQPPYGSFHHTRTNFDASVLVDFLKKDVFHGVVAIIGGLRPHEKEAVFHLLESLKIPVIADPNSGIREIVPQYLLQNGDLILQETPPGKVLRIGEVPIGRFWRDLDEQLEIEVLSLCQSGYSGLSRPSSVIKGDISRILTGAGEQEEIGDVLDLLKQENARQHRTDELLEAFPSSEPGLIHTLSIYASTGESLYLGNSLPIREWSQFAQLQTPYSEVWANRGANGIDGQIATWFGTTREVENAWALIGDLTAIYDLNALIMSEQIERTGRRLVIMNNQGGRIFGRLPRISTISTQESEDFAQSHQITFEALADLWNWEYLRVCTADDFDSLEGNRNSTIVEIIPDPNETSLFWERYQQHNH